VKLILLRGEIAEDAKINLCCETTEKRRVIFQEQEAQMDVGRKIKMRD